MTYAWCLFDADGTLFDFECTSARALERTFVDFRATYEPTFIDLYRSIDEALWEALEREELSRENLHVKRFADLLAAVGVKRDAKAFADRYLEHVGRGTDLIEGAESVVASLAGSARLALITNGFAAVQRSRFARSSLTPFFETIVISEEVGVTKPDPAVFDEAFRRMGSPAKDEVLMIGDSLTADIRGGIDYGIDTCWFNPRGDAAPTDLGITYDIRSLTELLTLA